MKTQPLFDHLNRHRILNGKNIREMKLKTVGITCAGCAKDMEKLLRETEGILDAPVHFADEVIHIKEDPRLIGRKQVYHGARKPGNIMHVISEPWSSVFFSLMLFRIHLSG